MSTKIKEFLILTLKATIEGLIIGLIVVIMLRLGWVK